MADGARGEAGGDRGGAARERARVADVARGATCEGREASGGASCRRERARRGGRERERLAMRGGADRAKREGAPRREAPASGAPPRATPPGAQSPGGGEGRARGEPRRLKKNEKMQQAVGARGDAPAPRWRGPTRARPRSGSPRGGGGRPPRGRSERQTSRVCEERASAPACSCVVPRCDRLEAEIGPRVYSRLSGTARRGAGAKQTLVPESRGPRLVADVTRHPVKIRILFAERPPRWFENRRSTRPSFGVTFQVSTTTTGERPASRRRYGDLLDGARQTGGVFSVRVVIDCCQSDSSPASFLRALALAHSSSPLSIRIRISLLSAGFALPPTPSAPRRRRTP